jgi:uncharacterized membrane-anchored protein
VSADRILMLVGAVLVFGVINWQIATKERLRISGQTVYLELAPVDPRSLMQGDYMALDFALAREIRVALNPGTEPEPEPEDERPRVAILQLDARRVGRFSRLDNGGPLSPGEVRFRFRIRNEQVWLGTNAFFMQEGDAERYRPARFGEFHVSDSGEAMLVDLRDAGLRKL